MKIVKHKELIELFNNTLTIENREFDVYKDSKLLSQIHFLQNLYYPSVNKISTYNVYYSLVLFNRLVNAKVTDTEKKIFLEEFSARKKYLVENFSNNYDNFKKKYNETDFTMLEEFDAKNIFDQIVEELKEIDKHQRTIYLNMYDGKGGNEYNLHLKIE
jgi:hypothetical protein